MFNHRLAKIYSDTILKDSKELKSLFERTFKLEPHNITSEEVINANHGILGIIRDLNNIIGFSEATSLYFDKLDKFCNNLENREQYTKEIEKLKCTSLNERLIYHFKKTIDEFTKPHLWETWVDIINNKDVDYIEIENEDGFDDSIEFHNGDYETSDEELIEDYGTTPDDSSDDDNNKWIPLKKQKIDIDSSSNLL